MASFTCCSEASATATDASIETGASVAATAAAGTIGAVVVALDRFETSRGLEIAIVEEDESAGMRTIPDVADERREVEEEAATEAEAAVAAVEFRVSANTNGPDELVVLDDLRLELRLLLLALMTAAVDIAEAGVGFGNEGYIATPPAAANAAALNVAGAKTDPTLPRREPDPEREEEEVRESVPRFFNDEEEADPLIATAAATAAAF